MWSTREIAMIRWGATRYQRSVRNRKFQISDYIPSDIGWRDNGLGRWLGGYGGDTPTEELTVDDSTTNPVEWCLTKTRFYGYLAMQLHVHPIFYHIRGSSEQLPFERPLILRFSWCSFVLTQYDFDCLLTKLVHSYLAIYEHLHQATYPVVDINVMRYAR